MTDVTEPTISPAADEAASPAGGEPVSPAAGEAASPAGGEVASLVGAYTGSSAGAHTAEELRNLEVIRALRRAPVEGRKAFMAPGVRIHRHGMAHLAERSGTRYQAAGIADRADDVHDMIAKGDRVWAVWTIRGTHTGSLFGRESTGRPIEVLEVGIWRLADGKVVEAWFLADEYALARTLDLLP